MSEIKLLNCPFCGGEAIFSDSMEDRRAEVHCVGCGARVDVKGYPALSKAFKLWNTRKPMGRILTRLEEKLSDTNFEKATQECNESYVDGLSMGYAEAIGIVKEEGGIE